MNKGRENKLLNDINRLQNYKCKKIIQEICTYIYKKICPGIEE